MRTLTALTIPLLMFATSAGTAPPKGRLPEHVIGLWCNAGSDEGATSYLRNDASAPKPDTPCSRDGRTEWIKIDDDGSYQGWEWGCKAVKLSVIYRGDTIKGTPGANAISAWRHAAKGRAVRGGSARGLRSRGGGAR